MCRPAYALIANVVVVTISSMLLAGSAAAHPDGSRWSIQPSPDPPGSVGSFLSSVACAGDGTCTAVGSYSPGSGVLTLAERWDGSNWTVEDTPNVPGAAWNLLTGISCPAPEHCIAVGYSVTTKVRPLVERWDGVSWTIVPTPRPRGAFWFELVAVSCAGVHDCVAVGSSIGRGVDAQERPLAEHWDGASWTIERTPNPHAENGSGLTGVSCLAGGVCEAVGTFTYADVQEGIFALGRDGATWVLQQQPDPGGGYVTAEDSVSCATGAACTSVGTWTDADGRIRALAGSWSGSAWTLQHARDPNGSAISELLGVSCEANDACIAVGDRSVSPNGTPSSTLAERWNGSAWRIQWTPNPNGATVSTLDGVTCAPSGACVAVGSATVDGVSSTLVEVSAP